MPVDVEASLSAAAFAFTAAKIAYDVTGCTIVPVTGYQYTKAGGEELDQALDIINGPRGENLDDHLLRNYLAFGHELITTKQKLTRHTETCIGSIMNIKAAKNFYTDASVLHEDAKSSSHQANIKKNMKALAARKEKELREAWEREREQLQTRRSQIEENVSLPPSPQFNHTGLSPPNGAYPCDPSGHQTICPQYLPDLGPVYPPSAYLSANSTRC